MGHDTHFLMRLSRVSSEQADRALTLYRDLPRHHVELDCRLRQSFLAQLADPARAAAEVRDLFAKGSAAGFQRDDVGLAMLANSEVSTWNEPDTALLISHGAAPSVLLPVDELCAPAARPDRAHVDGRRRRHGQGRAGQSLAAAGAHPRRAQARAQRPVSVRQRQEGQALLRRMSFADRPAFARARSARLQPGEDKETQTMPSSTATAGDVLARLISAHPPPAPPIAQAFSTLATDAQRAEAGARTKAAHVLKEGVDWAVVIDQALQSRARLSNTYSADRFGYFLQRLGALQAQLGADAGALKSTGGTRAQASASRAQGLALRDRLMRQLMRYAGHRDAVVAEVQGAQGTAATNPDLGAGLRALADLNDRYLAQTDAVQKVLVAAAGLDAAHGRAARALAQALGSASVDAVLAGKLSHVDSPAANALEGGVLLEMGNAMRAFEDARIDDPKVPKLTPGPATRAVLGQRRPHKATPKGTIPLPRVMTQT